MHLDAQCTEISVAADGRRGAPGIDCHPNSMGGWQKIFRGGARRLFRSLFKRKRPDVPMGDLAAEAERELLEAGVEVDVPVAARSPNRDPLTRG
jgi:hypothetical protein